MLLKESLQRLVSFLVEDQHIVAMHCHVGSNWNRHIPESLSVVPVACAEPRELAEVITHRRFCRESQLGRKRLPSISQALELLLELLLG